MIDIKNISKENWDNILRTNSADDIDSIEYLKEYEEEILNILIENGIDMSLDEKRKQYIREIFSDVYREGMEDIVSKIEEIRKNEGYSILQLGKRLHGSSYVVLEFGDKVLKLVLEVITII